MLTKCMYLFCILLWRKNFALDLRVVNHCSLTISLRYNHTKQSDGCTIGPRSYSDLNITDGSHSLTMWATYGASAECSSSQSGLTTNVSAIFFGDDGSYYVSLAGNAPDIDACPHAESMSGSCSCASTCSCKNAPGRPICPDSCGSRHRCDSTVVAFIVNFCPEGNATWPKLSTVTKVSRTTSRSTFTTVVKSTTKEKTTAWTKNPTKPKPERSCACSGDKLWLDVIIAVDTSTTMGSTGLESIVNMLDRVFDDVDVGQASDQQTRISIISYASKARIISNLSTYDTTSQFEAGLASVQLTPSDPAVGLFEAFEAFNRVINVEESGEFSAANMMQNLKQQVNRKIVCIVFASAYGPAQRDPMELVQKLKDDGHYVLTVSAVPKNGDVPDAQRIGNMASKGMNFTIDREAARVPEDVINMMRRSLCQANCFCVNGRIHMRDSVAQCLVEERPCACHPEKLWLDVIIATDNSASMGRVGLAQVTAILMTAIEGITIGQGLVHQTRIGLITINANATVVGTLTYYRNKRDVQMALAALRPSDYKRVNLLAGLEAADITWEEVKAARRQVVFVLVASAYSGQGRTDPTPFASQLKESGVKILTLAFIRHNEGDEEVQKISNLASPGFSFRTDKDQTTLANKVQQAFCRANCFCPNGWVQFADDFQEPTMKYGECVQLSSAPSTWFGASLTCANEVDSKAFLASERSDAKHKFHADYVRSVRGMLKPYFIGLSWDNARRQYIWSEKYDNGTQIPLDPSEYQGWAGGNGSHIQTPDGVEVVPLGFDTYWHDVDRFRMNAAYMCQVNACDTDNYCDDSIDD